MATGNFFILRRIHEIQSAKIAPGNAPRATGGAGSGILALVVTFPGTQRRANVTDAAKIETRHRFAEMTTCRDDGIPPLFSVR